MEELRERSDFDRLLEQPLAVIFKHSTLCGISARARREVTRFLAEYPDHRVYEVDVHAGRTVSSYIEEKTGVRHESPQLLVLRCGRVVWHGSHSGVSAKAMAAEIARGAEDDV